MTFGLSDVYLDDRLAAFELAKSKEIPACPAGEQGSGAARPELFAAVREDRSYDRRMQKQLDVYIRSLRETLQEYGISEIIEMKKGIRRTRPDAIA